MSSFVPRLVVGGETLPAPPLTSGEFLVIMCVYVFNLRSSHLRLTLGHAPLCSFILLSASQHRWLNAIGQKKAPPHVLAITWDTQNRDREKSSGQANLLNQGQNLRSTSGQPDFVANQFFEIPASAFVWEVQSTYATITKQYASDFFALLNTTGFLASRCKEFIRSVGFDL